MSTATSQRIFAPFEVKARNDEARTFEGLAAAFTIDTDGDVIHRGAFANTLAEWKSSGRVLPLMDRHAAKLNPAFNVTEHTLGKLIAAEERDEGLWARFQIAKTRAGDDLLALLKDGMVEGLSIGFNPIKPERDAKGIRHIRDLHLGEISVVTWGAHPDTLVNLASVKTRLPDMEPAELGDLYSSVVAQVIQRKAEPDMKTWIDENHKSIRSQNGHLLRDAPPAEAAAAPAEEKAETPETPPAPAADATTANVKTEDEYLYGEALHQRMLRLRVTTAMMGAKT